MKQKNKAVFLDRDGVINIDKSYLYKKEDFIFCDGIFELLKYVTKLGYELFIITNQSGIARGYYNEDDFQKLTLWMLKEFEKKDIKIKKVYYCPHLPEDGCECRKPKPKMIQDAIKEFDLNPKNSWMIGDKSSDIEAAKNAGVKNSILISAQNKKKSSAKYIVQSLYDIIKIIKD